MVSAASSQGEEAAARPSPGATVHMADGTFSWRRRWFNLIIGKGDGPQPVREGLFWAFHVALVQSRATIAIALRGFTMTEIDPSIHPSQDRLPPIGQILADLSSPESGKRAWAIGECLDFAPHVGVFLA